jgi:predicted negative regulator of RcsB-dependent stress response
MDEEILIIDSKTRNEKIKNFFINNKKKLVACTSILLVSIISFFSLEEIKIRNKIKLAEKFNLVIINFQTQEKQKTINELTNLVKENEATYSPLALYFLIDNNLIKDKNEINILFDELIDETKLDEEIKNLIIYKKALFNSEFASENELLQMLNPIINSESIWKAHALYLIAEYFYSNNEKKKSKEFFSQILLLKNGNIEIKKQSQKRINRDLSE